MAVKRKREDKEEANAPSTALVLPDLTAVEKALKSEDAPIIQGASVSCLKLFTACRQAETTLTAREHVQQHFNTSATFGKSLLAALQHAAAIDNTSLLIVVLNTVTSFISLHILSLSTVQNELVRQTLTDQANLLSRNLGQGKNDLNAVTLKLLSVIAKDTSSDGWSSNIRKIWTIISSDAKNIGRLLRTRQKKEVAGKKRSDIRTLILSVLVSLLSLKSPVSVRLDLLNMANVVPAIFKTLEEDSRQTILAVLRSVFLGVINEARIPADVRAKTAEASFPTALLLLNKSPEEAETSQNSVASSTLRFVQATISSLQSAYRPGSTDRPIKRALTTLLAELKYTEDERHFDLVIDVLRGTPDLLGGFWHKIFPSLEPRQATRWMISMHLTMQLLSSATSPSLDLCMPAPFNKTWFSKGLQSDNPLIQHLFCLLLSVILQRCAPVKADYPELSNRLNSRLNDNLPDVQIIVSLLQKSSASADDKQPDMAAFDAIRLLNLYYAAAPEAVAGLRFDLSKTALAILDDSKQEITQQIILANLLRLISQPSSSISWIKGANAEDTIVYRLCQLFLRASAENIGKAAKRAVTDLLCSSSLFDANQKAEIGVWLDALADQESPRDAILSSWVSCVQRAENTPMKYVEASLEIATSKSEQLGMADPLLACWTDQLAHQDGAHYLPLAQFTNRVISGLVALNLNREVAAHYISEAQSTFKDSKKALSEMKAAKKNCAVSKTSKKATQRTLAPINGTAESNSSSSASVSTLSQGLPQTLKKKPVSQFTQEESEKVTLKLVRRFAEDDGDVPETLMLVHQYTAYLESIKIALGAHIADPCVIAAIQRRLPQIECVRLAMLLFKTMPLSNQSKNSQKYVQLILAHPMLAAVLTDATQRIALLDFLSVLYLANPAQVSQTQFLGSILPYFYGTFEEGDVLISDMLRHAEVMEHAAIGPLLEEWLPVDLVDNELDVKGPGLLAVLDPAKMWQTCLAIVHGKSNTKDRYDASLIIGLFQAYLEQPEIKIREFVGLMASNVIGVLVCSLASENISWQMAADRLLSRLRIRIQNADIPEVEELLLILDHVSNWTQAGSQLNAISALFVSRCCQAIANPTGHHYSPMMRYLLQRAMIEQDDIPLLYQTLYPQEESTAEDDRMWIITLITEGMATLSDWAILRRRQTWELLAGYFAQPLSSVQSRKTILKFLENATLHDNAVEYMVRRAGIFLWISEAEIRNQEETTILITVLNQCVQNSDTTRLGRYSSIWAADAASAFNKLASTDTTGRGKQQLTHALRRFVVKIGKDASTVDGTTSRSIYNTTKLLANCFSLTQDIDTRHSAAAYLHDSAVRMAILSDRTPKLSLEWIELVRDLSKLVAEYSATLSALFSGK